MPIPSQAADHSDRARFLAGDPLRAIAALCVLGYHVALVVALPETQPGPSGLRDAMVLTFGPWIGEVTYGTRLGLGLFFVLSGYLLARPLVRSWICGAPPPSSRGYAANRLLRIVPAFWIAAALTFVLTQRVGATITDVAAVLGFAQIYHQSDYSYFLGQAWSLDVEMQFYALLGIALVLRTLRPDRRPRPWVPVLGWIVAAWLVSLAAIEIRPADGAWTTSLPAMLQAFLPGVALAVLEDPIARFLETRQRLARRVPPALLVVALALAIAHVSRSSRFDGLEAANSSLIAGLVLGAALIREWATGRSWFVLDNPVLRWLGRRSYGIFLYQWGAALLLAPIVVGIADPVLRTIGLLLLVLPLTLLAAALSWALIEGPALRLRLRWTSPGAEPARPRTIPIAGGPRGERRA